MVRDLYSVFRVKVTREGKESTQIFGNIGWSGHLRMRQRVFFRARVLGGGAGVLLEAPALSRSRKITHNLVGRLKLPDW